MTTARYRVAADIYMISYVSKRDAPFALQLIDFEPFVFFILRMLVLIDIANKLKWIGFGNAMDDAGKNDYRWTGLFDDLIDCRHVKVLHCRPQRVAQQVLGKASDKLSLRRRRGL